MLTTAEINNEYKALTSITGKTVTLYDYNKHKLITITWWHCATSRKVAGTIHDGVIGIVH
jgi:hypothetical protein